MWWFFNSDDPLGMKLALAGLAVLVANSIVVFYLGQQRERGRLTAYIRKLEDETRRLRNEAEVLRGSRHRSSSSARKAA